MYGPFLFLKVLEDITMPGKPTYEELTERIEELEQEAFERQHAEVELVKSKAMFEAVIESLPFDVFALDCNNRYILQNSICTKNWGDLNGKSPEDVGIDKHTKHLWLENNRRALSGETITGEVVYDRLNGEKSYYYNIITPIRDEEKIFGILGVIIDVSELKQAEEALREGEKRFRRLVETMNDGIGIQDENGLITYVNNKFCQMLDYKPDDFIGKPVTNFLDDYNRQILKNQTAVRRKGKVKPYEIEWTCEDGRKIQTIMSPQAIFNEKGQFKGSFSVITDISTLKQVEEALRESEENFRALAKNANDGILIAIEDGRHVFANNRTAEITGYSVHELLKTTIRDLAHPDEFEKIEKRYKTIIAGKSFQNQYETMIIRKDGKEVPIEVTSAKFIWFGQPADIVIIRDISERKRAEEELRKAHSELEHRVKERTIELELKTKSLEEINTAMKVLLKKREEDKAELEDNVLINVKELIVPYLEKIKKTKLDDQQEVFLSIIESNLNEIISPFTRKMSLKYLNLTPSEIQIANLIRHGSTTKKIAELLNISPRTVESHRKNIRRKIGLEHKRANLRSHLLSLH